MSFLCLISQGVKALLKVPIQIKPERDVQMEYKYTSQEVEQS